MRFGKSRILYAWIAQDYATYLFKWKRIFENKIRSKIVLKKKTNSMPQNLNIKIFRDLCVLTIRTFRKFFKSLTYYLLIRRKIHISFYLGDSILNRRTNISVEKRIQQTWTMRESRTTTGRENSARREMKESSLEIAKKKKRQPPILAVSGIGVPLEGRRAENSGRTRDEEETRGRKGEETSSAWQITARIPRIRAARKVRAN